MDKPTDVFPEEAEQLMGMEKGTTAGEGITNIDRLRCIGAGWDINASGRRPPVIHTFTPSWSDHIADVYQ